MRPVAANCILAIGLTVPCILTTPCAAGPGRTRAVVVLDVSVQQEKGNDASQENRALVVTEQLALEELLSRLNDTGATPESLLKGLRSSLAKTSDRWVSAKGDELLIYVFTQGENVPLSVDEKDRSSRLTSDLGTLIKLAPTVGGLGVTSPDVEVGLQKSSYRLQKSRGTLTVRAGTDPSSFSAAAQGSPPPSAKATVTTGPVEGFFLTADVVTRNISETKFNSDTGALETRDKPGRFLLGLAATVGGDLYQGEYSDWWRGTTVKVMLEASAKPLNTVAAGIGYRWPKGASKLGLPLDTISPFVALLWTRRDKLEGSSVSEELGTAKAIFGFSFHLDRAVDWVTRKSD